MSFFRCGGGSGGIDVTAASYPETNPFTIAAQGSKTITFSKPPKLIKIICFFHHTNGSDYTDIICGDLANVICSRLVDNSANVVEQADTWGNAGIMAVYSITASSLTINLSGGGGYSRKYILTVWY